MSINWSRPVMNNCVQTGLSGDFYFEDAVYDYCHHNSLVCFCFCFPCILKMEGFMGTCKTKDNSLAAGESERLCHLQQKAEGREEFRAKEQEAKSKQISRTLRIPQLHHQWSLQRIFILFSELVIFRSLDSCIFKTRKIL